MTSPDPLLVAVNSARVCVERFRVRPQSTHLISTALNELDDAMDLLNRREAAMDEQWATKAVRDAVRAALRSRTGLELIERVLDEQDGGDPVWAEDRVVNLIVDNLRAAGETP